jgi:hypothetical protein
VQRKPVANYGYTVGKNKPAFLTDGRYSVNNPIWTDSLTLGWTLARTISITIDLEKISNYWGIKLNTASNEMVGADLPLNILVFASKDDSSYLYMGDMMKGISQKKGYTLSKLSLLPNKAVGRYILFKIIPRSHYFFTDEIEVSSPPLAHCQLIKKKRRSLY